MGHFNPAVLTSILSALILFLGGLWPVMKSGALVRHHHRLLAFGAGVLLGVAFLDMIPEAMEFNENLAGLGLALAFIIILAIEQRTSAHECPDCSDDRENGRQGIVFPAFLFHNLLDGIALGVGFEVSTGLGVAILIALLLHQFPTGTTLGSLLIASGMDRRAVLLRIGIGALAIPFAAILTALFVRGIGDSAFGLLLGLSAGTFIYIAGVEVLPEVSRDSSRTNFVFFLTGILFIFIARLMGAG